ncbi:hypothetical protein [Thermaerobacillus caldiproteolyticus]|uniref:hypothetical protein n=1 Tax=Thermaerobacillus caldiproteolyticus TaxID=247480 RepID=UPI001F2E9081|nr:hypothetical protein [Anoxybacillus caldiproteolyticus]
MRLLFLTFLFPIIILSQVHPTFAETDAKQLESQINSFISGLRTETPKQSVELWILGVKNRSGAVPVLSSSLQERTRKQFEEANWGTGQSSPWVDNFRVVKVKKISDTKLQFTIAYNLVTSYARLGSGQKVITVEKNPEPYRTNWFITKITTKYNQWEAFAPAETVIK